MNATVAAAMTDEEKSVLERASSQLEFHFQNGGLLRADPPAGTPSQTNLNDILDNAVKLPSATSIATVPTAPLTPGSDVTVMLGQMETLDSYISLLVAYCIYNEKPDGYDITKSDQAAAFTQALAKWRAYVVTGGAVKSMAGYLPVHEIVSSSYSQEVTSAELHSSFLTELFGGFNFDASAIKELDSILTSVFASLSNVSVESTSSSIDHFLTLYYFAVVQGTGGDTGIPPALTCNLRTFYLHIDKSSWIASSGKGSVTKFAFHMNYVDMSTVMNGALVAQDMATINTSIQTLTGRSAAEINKLMNMQAIHSDPKPA